MANDEFFLAGEGAIFVQPDGPNTDVQYLGCHQLGDLTQPIGDIQLYHCPDPSAPNRWQVMGSSQGAPGPVTTEILTSVKKLREYLDLVKCPAAMWVNLYKCGRTDQFLGYERSFFVKNFYKTQRANLTIKTSPSNPMVLVRKLRLICSRCW